MPLIARASNTVRNKNLLIILLCAGMTIWFVYDGWVGYPASNDRLVQSMKTQLGKTLDEKYRSTLESWPGWNNAGPETRDAMDNIAQNIAKVEGWQSPFDILVQKWIVIALAAGAAASIWWFIHCQKRRAIAEEDTVSPAPGVAIPWEKITRIDNTRWKTVGIVTITYTDESGASKKAEFDDYKLNRNALLPILDLLAEKAVNAEMIPKEEPAPPSSGSV